MSHAPAHLFLLGSNLTSLMVKLICKVQNIDLANAYFLTEYEHPDKFPQGYRASQVSSCKSIEINFDELGYQVGNYYDYQFIPYQVKLDKFIEEFIGKDREIYLYVPHLSRFEYCYLLTNPQVVKLSIFEEGSLAYVDKYWSSAIYPQQELAKFLEEYPEYQEVAIRDYLVCSPFDIKFLEEKYSTNILQKVFTNKVDIYRLDDKAFNVLEKEYFNQEYPDQQFTDRSVIGFNSRVYTDSLKDLLFASASANLDSQLRGDTQVQEQDLVTKSHRQVAKHDFIARVTSYSQINFITLSAELVKELPIALQLPQIYSQDLKSKVNDSKSASLSTTKDFTLSRFASIQEVLPQFTLDFIKENYPDQIQVLQAQLDQEYPVYNLPSLLDYTQFIGSEVTPQVRDNRQRIHILSYDHLPNLSIIEALNVYHHLLLSLVNQGITRLYVKYHTMISSERIALVKDFCKRPEFSSIEFIFIDDMYVENEFANLPQDSIVIHSIASTLLLYGIVFKQQFRAYADLTYQYPASYNYYKNSYPVLNILQSMMMERTYKDLLATKIYLQHYLEGLQSITSLELPELPTIEQLTYPLSSKKSQAKQPSLSLEEINKPLVEAYQGDFNLPEHSGEILEYQDISSTPEQNVFNLEEPKVQGIELELDKTLANLQVEHLDLNELDTQGTIVNSATSFEQGLFPSLAKDLNLSFLVNDSFCLRDYYLDAHSQPADFSNLIDLDQIFLEHNLVQLDAKNYVSLYIIQSRKQFGAFIQEIKDGKITSANSLVILELDQNDPKYKLQLNLNYKYLKGVTIIDYYAYTKLLWANKDFAQRLNDLKDPQSPLAIIFSNSFISSLAVLSNNRQLVVVTPDLQHPLVKIIRASYLNLLIVHYEYEEFNSENFKLGYLRQQNRDQIGIINILQTLKAYLGYISKYQLDALQAYKLQALVHQELPELRVNLEETRLDHLLQTQEQLEQIYYTPSSTLKIVPWLYKSKKPSFWLKLKFSLLNYHYRKGRK